MPNVVDLRRTAAPAPSIESGKVRPPSRRRHLTPDEVEAKLIPAAGRLGRHGHRDATLILLAYRHGLRVSELVALRWDAMDLRQGLLHVSRLKNGVPSTHPLRGPELRALRRLQREYPASPYVFVTERRGPLTEAQANAWRRRLPALIAGGELLRYQCARAERDEVLAMHCHAA